VLLGDKATLEAKGSDAVKDGGGGGGGVIAIRFTEGFVGREPTALESTKGGNGTVPGDNGMVVINGKLGTIIDRQIENLDHCRPSAHAARLPQLILFPRATRLFLKLVLCSSGNGQNFCF